MDIYFLRHIKTNYNLSNRISGSKNVDVLPDQTIVTNISLPKFDYIFCSPLARCKETLYLIPDIDDVPIIYDNSLIERNVGVLEGMKKKEAMMLYPELFINGRINVDRQIPGGESICDMVERLSSGIIPKLYLHKDETVLICSHNQILKVLYSILNNIRIDNKYWMKTNFENGKIIRMADI